MAMTKYLARRIIEILITLFIITTLIFILFRAMPGDPASLVLSPRMTPEIKQIIRERFGLDKPLYVQYLIYMRNLLHGQFGTSFYYNQDVWGILKQKLPPTLLLFGTGEILAYIIGIYLGRIIAWRRGSRLEYSATVFGIIFYTMPIFWFGLLAIWIFSYKLGWFPIGGFKSPEVWATAVNASVFVKIFDILKHLILPLSAFTLYIFAGNMLLMRNSMLETLREDYILTARAKGLPESVVRNRHAARNAMLPVVTAMALSVAAAFSGGVLTETVFSWQGLGSTLVEATLNYDYPLAQGAFILLAGLVLIAVLTADLLYVLLDPRIRY